MKNREEITRLLNEVFCAASHARGVQLLDDASVENGPINTIAQVFEVSQVQARAPSRSSYSIASAGKAPLVASPMRFSETPINTVAVLLALGQHTDEIRAAC